MIKIQKFILIGSIKLTYKFIHTHSDEKFINDS